MRGGFMRNEQAQSKCFLGRLCLPFLGALFVLASLPLFATEALALQVNVQRVAGDTRYDTMSELISNVGGWSASDKVILASGANYPDALSASALAGVHDAPIILTDPTELSSKAAATIKQLGPSTIYVVGGPSAVSDEVLQAANNICGSNTIRLYGSTRYETSLEILRQCNSSSDTVIVATGANYADSLSISPFAYVTKSPIVLCDPNGGLTQEAIEAIRAGGFSRAILVGGNAAVPDVVISQLNNANIATDGIRHLSGATRYETSTQITAFEISETGLFTADPLGFATGSNYADALAMGPCMGRINSPLLLVDNGAQTVCACIERFKGNVGNAFVAGGINAVSDDDYQRIVVALTPNDTPTQPKPNLTDLSGAQVKVPQQQYTGQPLTPAPEVTLGDQKLKKDVDYSVSYSNNTKAGTATVTVTGINQYTGVAKGTFEIIDKPSVSKQSVNIPSPAKLTYSGSSQTAIASNEIYTVKNGAATNAGSYKATLSLKDKDSYQWASTGKSDDIEVNWSISAASISSAKVSAAKQTFNGQALSPSVTVKLGDRTLKSGTDYAVSYSNNQHAGTAEATVTGKGNYTGTASGTFTISPANISEASISVAAQNYTGSQLTPVPTVTLDGKSLESGTDFTTSYSNNVKVGTANITVTGKGDYTGSATSTFKITRGQATVKKVKVGEITVTVYSYPDGYSYVDVPNQWLSISTCNNTNRCVDVAAVSKDNGANVQLWDNNGVTGQIWKFVEKSEGVYRIKNAYSDKYLSLDSNHKNEEGCNVLQLSSSGRDDQLWRAEVYNNKLMFINVHSNYVLDCYGGYADNGTNIQVWSRNNSKAQLFELKPETIKTKGTRTITVGNVSVTEHTYDNGDRYYVVSEGMYIIQSCSGSNQVLDVVGGGKDNGVNVNSWSSNGTNWQKWQFVKTENGIYKIINVNSGKCLEVAGQDTNVNGGNVQQWDYVGGNNQKWKLWLTKDNKLVFLNLATQRALNITGNTATNGANVTIQDRNLSANQSWTLRRTSKQIDPNEECNRISVETWNAVREYRQKNGLYVPGGNDTFCDNAASYSSSHCAAAGRMAHDYYHEYRDSHSWNGWNGVGENLATAHAGATGRSIVNSWWDDKGHPDLGHRKNLNRPGMRVCGVKTSYNANNNTYYVSMVFAGTNLGNGGTGGSKL